MQALHDVVKAGYVRYIGMSSCYAYQCMYPFPSMVCDVTLTWQLCSPCDAELRDHQQAHAVYLDAEPS